MNEEILNLRNNTEKANEFFSKKLAYTIGPVELKELSQENEIVIVDVRKHADYEISHIPNAISIPYEDLNSRIDELEKGKLHIIYCYNTYCHLGAKAAVIMTAHQIPVMELCGGFKTWSEEFRFATS
jgi:rhodanese-related sulfurtransferase